MRTSAGLWEIGLSGKMRIQIRPPRFMCRVIARRAASICRAVKRPRPTALSPYSPKLTLAPRVAIPLLRPFCCLRYFVLAGCCIFCSWLYCLSCRRGGRLLSRRVRVPGAFAFGGVRIEADLGRFGGLPGCTPAFRLSPGGRHLRGTCGAWLITSPYYFTLEHPDLNSNHTVRRLGLRNPIIQIRAQSM